MFRSHWSHNLLGLTRTRKDCRSQRTKQQQRVRLILEPLEDRITPSNTLATQMGTRSNTPDPHIAVSNALATETGTMNYILQILNSYTRIVGGQTSNSTSGNGPTLTIAEQNALIGTLNALTQDLTAIGNILSSANLSPNEVALFQLLLQQQMQSTGQSQVAQHTAPTSPGLVVSA
ncbi:MAG TPA: hypothetical protein VH592_08970 [Gemmataceae bacterium]|jgi:hypothetical protein